LQFITFEADHESTGFGNDRKKKKKVEWRADHIPLVILSHRQTANLTVLISMGVQIRAMTTNPWGMGRGRSTSTASRGRSLSAAS